MRPLMNLNSEELRARFADSAGDTAALSALKDELSYRKTHAARELMAEVARALGSIAGADAPEAMKGQGQSTAPLSDTPSSARFSFNPEPIERAYARLRATFSEEGEVLARWGMTPALPEPLRRVLLEGWRRILRSAPTPDGRTLEEFERDMDHAARIGARKH